MLQKKEGRKIRALFNFLATLFNLQNNKKKKNQEKKKKL